MDVSKQINYDSSCSSSYAFLIFILIGIGIFFILFILLWRAFYRILETIQYIYIDMPLELTVPAENAQNIEEEHIYEEIQ